MNTDDQIAIFIHELINTFPGEVRPMRVEIYFQDLKEDLRKIDLRALRRTLARQYTFLPAIKEILDIVNPQPTAREKARDFVELMIGALQGSKPAPEAAGEDNYRFWRDTIGLNRSDLNNIGNINIAKAQWVERITAIYRQEETQKLQHKQLKGGT